MKVQEKKVKKEKKEEKKDKKRQREEAEKMPHQVVKEVELKPKEFKLEKKEKKKDKKRQREEAEIKKEKKKDKKRQRDEGEKILQKIVQEVEVQVQPKEIYKEKKEKKRKKDKKRQWQEAETPAEKEREETISEVEEGDSKKKKKKREKREKKRPRAEIEKEKNPENFQVEETPTKRRVKKPPQRVIKKEEPQSQSQSQSPEEQKLPVIVSAPADRIVNKSNTKQNEDESGWRASHKRIDVKSGPYSTAEKNTIKGGVEAFARARGFSTDDYSWILAGKGQRNADVLGLWKHVAAALPHRTIKSVAAAGNRMLHPDANKGKWTPAEDEELRAEVGTHGNKWAVIGVRLGRPREACRVRWREIQLGDKKASGPWQEDEEKKLVDAVKAYLAAKKAAEGGGEGSIVNFSGRRGGGGGGLGGGSIVGNTPAADDKNRVSDVPEGSPGTEKLDRRVVLDDIDWGVISKRVGTRSNVQCLEKWYDQLAPSMVERGDWGPGDDRRMLRALWLAAPAAEFEVKWGEVVGGRTAVQARRRWRLMAKAVPDHREMEFSEIIDYLVTQYMPRLKEKAPREGKQGGTPEEGAKSE